MTKSKLMTRFKSKATSPADNKITIPSANQLPSVQSIPASLDKKLQSLINQGLPSVSPKLCIAVC